MDSTSRTAPTPSPSSAPTYESGFGASRLLTAPQKLAELTCERQALKKGVVLSGRFWEAPPWKRAFLDQVRGASSLLHVYSPAALFAAFRAEPRMLSWNGALAREAAHAAQARLDAEEARRAESPPPAPIPDPGEGPRPRPRRGSGLRSRLS